MRISDWSSDVCSSDLPGCPHRRLRRLLARELPHGLTLGVSPLRPWASANFVGARHLFPCSVAAGDDQGLARTLHAHLGAVEFRVPAPTRPDARRVGKVCVSPCKPRWSPVT